MDPRHKRFLAAFIALFVLTAMIIGVRSGATAATEGEPGSSPDNPIVVSDLSDIPAEAAISAVLNKDCSTTYTGVLTIPATNDTEHQEWGTEERTREYYPGSEEVSHQVYSYVKTVADFKTKYQYQKQVKGVVQQRDNGQGQWHNTGQTFDWEWWVGNTTQWSFSDVDVLESGSHNATQATWTQSGHQWRKQTTQYRYVKNGVTEQVPNGSHDEYSGEVLEPLGDPWVLLPGYPKTVVDQEAVPASYGEWTEWTVRTSGDLVEPVLPDNTDTHEYRMTGPVTVVDTEGTPETVVYYQFNDGKTCDNPPSDEPKDPEPSVDKKCVGDALVIKKTDSEGNTETAYINGAPQCTEKGVVYTEEGM